MSTNEPEHENRDVEETGANEDLVSNQCQMMRIDMQRESSVSDRPRFDGFDLPIGVPLSRRKPRMRHFDYKNNKPRTADRALIKVYAQLGLHRYNLLEGTNWQFFCLESYNMGMNTGAAPYYLTLFAADPSSGEIQPFHALVCEERICCLDISVHIARPRGSKDQPRLCSPTYTPRPLPRWPNSEMIAQHFYMLNEHELRNTDWVHMYLDLAHCTCNRGITESQLSGFEIVQVAIESLNDAEPPRLNSTNAVVYIVYKDLVKARLGKPSYRKAIIRRVYNESSRSLSLQGKHWSPSENEENRCAQPGVWDSMSTGNVASALGALVDQ